MLVMTIFNLLGWTSLLVILAASPVTATNPHSLEVHSKTVDNPTNNSIEITDSIRVERFEFKGNTVFTSDELQQVVSTYLNRNLTFADLLQARSDITNFYLKKGYITSGAFLPISENQAIASNNGIITIEVIEGKLEAIDVTDDSNRRLDGYVRSRLADASSPVLNKNRLVEALLLLQQDPLIDSISTTLSSGAAPGLNRLSVRVVGKPTVSTQISLNNNRSPSIGEFERQVQVGQANLLGLGDGLIVSYSNTDGSNSIQSSYTLPINTKNGTVRFSYGSSSSNIIEAPFSALDIIASSQLYELSLRQPIIRSASPDMSQELAVGVTFSRQESQTALLQTPFPLSQGADDQGKTRISAIRFFQDYLERGNQEVLFLRSQLSVGLNVFGSTINSSSPDSNFVAWRGQAQWLRRLDTNSGLDLFVRLDAQVTDRPLVTLEQFSLGGSDTVRGYRQDILLSDGGLFASAELRVPILKVGSGAVQLIPFVDFGQGWNNRDPLSASTLASTGLGLLWQQDGLNARLDWGIPLVNIPNQRSTLQENGLYFSVKYLYSF